MEIKLINANWCVNRKQFNCLTPNEKIILKSLYIKLKKIFEDETN